MRIFINGLFCAATLLTSCESKTGTGALVGAGVGAGAGALIGGGQGALIGGAVGAVGGAVIGNLMDSEDRRAVQNTSPQTMKKIDRGEQLSKKDIEKMSQAGISDEKIISVIDSTGSVFHLNSSDVLELKNGGVSKRVIDHMMQTGY